MHLKTKSIILTLLLLAGFGCFAQTVTNAKFAFGKDTFDYVKLDYGKQGVTSVYINMYMDTSMNSLIPSYAEDCLKDLPVGGHSVYYFITVPQKYDQLQRDMLFYRFAKHIVQKDKISAKATLSLNFDKDYSGEYQKDLQSDSKMLKIERIYNKTSVTNICERLTDPTAKAGKK